MHQLLISSRRRHTRYWRDWSSDVCSSDLFAGMALSVMKRMILTRDNGILKRCAVLRGHFVRETESEKQFCEVVRSEERRVGKSVDLGGRRIIKKKKIVASTSSLACHVSVL